MRYVGDRFGLLLSNNNLKINDKQEHLHMCSKRVYGLHIKRGTSTKKRKEKMYLIVHYIKLATRKFTNLHFCKLTINKQTYIFIYTTPQPSYKSTCFLAGTVFWRFHSLRVWSSETVTNTGSTGWKARARTPSKWLRRVYFGFHVFLNASLLSESWEWKSRDKNLF